MKPIESMDYHLEIWHSKSNTKVEKTESRTSNVRLRLFGFSVNIRNFVGRIPKKLWNKRVRGNEHSVNNLEKCNKTYSKAWFKTPSSSRIQVRKDFILARRTQPKNEETVKIHHKQNETWWKAWLKTFGSYPIQVRKDFFIGKNFGNSLIKMLFPLPILWRHHSKNFAQVFRFSTILCSSIVRGTHK